jgi:hypothetical protein
MDNLSALAAKAKVGKRKSLFFPWEERAFLVDGPSGDRDLVSPACGGSAP